MTYNANGGSAVAPVTVAENSNLTAPNAPTKNGYTFHGWYKDAAFTNSWNFDADTVTGNITLYAKWTETTKNYGISGKVYESNGTTPRFRHFREAHEGQYAGCFHHFRN